jgi:hypothetical protein
MQVLDLSGNPVSSESSPCHKRCNAERRPFTVLDEDGARRSLALCVYADSVDKCANAAVYDECDHTSGKAHNWLA